MIATASIAIEIELKLMLSDSILNALHAYFLNYEGIQYAMPLRRQS